MTRPKAPVPATARPPELDEAYARVARATAELRRVQLTRQPPGLGRREAVTAREVECLRELQEAEQQLDELRTQRAMSAGFPLLL